MLGSIDPLLNQFDRREIETAGHRDDGKKQWPEKGMAGDRNGGN